MALLSNRYIQLVIAVLLGGAITYLFLPTKIETHEVEKIVNKDVVVHQVKIIKPDGTTTIVTDTHDLSHEQVKDTSKKVVIYNDKRLLVYGGINPLHTGKYVLGASYDLWGPVSVGASYQDGVYITAGLRF